MNKKPKLDELDEKLSKFFPGRIVRKDLMKNLKVGFTIPVFVLEYLLGKYCSTTDEDEIQSGLVHVKTAISERIVRGDESELVKARLERLGSVKLIDLVTVTFDERGGRYCAHFATCGLSHVNVDPKLVYRNERLLTGGVWSNVELVYDEPMIYHGVLRPFVLSRLSPIQVASVELEESKHVISRTYTKPSLRWFTFLRLTCHNILFYELNNECWPFLCQNLYPTIRLYYRV